MRFFPREKGKMAFVEGFSLKRPFSLARVGKVASNRGSLISVPLALGDEPIIVNIYEFGDHGSVYKGAEFSGHLAFTTTVALCEPPFP